MSEEPDEFAALPAEEIADRLLRAGWKQADLFILPTKQLLRDFPELKVWGSRPGIRWGFYKPGGDGDGIRISSLRTAWDEEFGQPSTEGQD